LPNNTTVKKVVEMENPDSGVLSTLLAWVPTELRIWLILFIIVTLILIVILFRREIGGLLQRISDIDYHKDKGFSLHFGENLKQAQQQKNRNANLTQGDRAVTRPQETNRPSLSSRDLVLEAWGSLKQVIYDVAVAQKIPLTSATRPLEALNRLLNANIIGTAQHEHLELLYSIGRQVADSTNFPSKGDAVSYHELVYDVLDWMMCNAFSIKLNEPPKISRKTQVGGDIFPSPSLGKPAARLRGISGPEKGKQFHLEKELFTIGANPENDLVISGDSFISGTHAYLRYDKGYIMLSDLHSRNGTFLNGIRLKDAPMIVKVGDRIEVGNSAFELI
jgi:hypothetical protein